MELFMESKQPQSPVFKNVSTFTSIWVYGQGLWGHVTMELQGPLKFVERPYKENCSCVSKCSVKPLSTGLSTKGYFIANLFM